VNLPLITRAQEHNEKIAILVARGCANATNEGTFTYRDLLHTSGQIATLLLQNAEDLQEQPVAFLIPPGFEYVATQWGIWRAGGIAVPLCISHSRPELEYAIANSGAYHQNGRI
jgi:malonyl-CoA/methylmalonyl-CoA synthetase